MSNQSQYEVPSAEKLRLIASKQDAKEKEFQKARTLHMSTKEGAAAQLIQRNYRDHRARRELKGYCLSPSQRWVEAIKDAQYEHSTRPISEQERSTQTSPHSHLAKDKWHRARAVAQRANGDNNSITSESDSQESPLTEAHKQMKRERSKAAVQIMGLEYFLEMVDHHHRYGSNLRRYHKEWQQSGTKENFFYWLDYGDGKDLDLEDRPRKRLDEEKVRYLSKEEREKYLVTVDSEGLLCWAKNGERITTSPEYRDSMEGIVPVSDNTTPTWCQTTGREKQVDPSDDSDSVSGVSVGSNEDAARYTNQELHDAKGISKIKHISTGTIMNSLLRKTTKKNTWIFVTDTSFRMYVGIKQSGYFQHSSFFSGKSTSCAGLIRIKRGQVRRLSPLSGHYSTHAENFRLFVNNLKESRVDMSHVSISRSYAVLRGLEGYLGAKKGVKKGEQHVKDLLNPAEARQRKEKQQDTSASAKKERAFLEAQAAEKEELRRRRSLTTRMMKKLQVEDIQREASAPATEKR